MLHTFLIFTFYIFNKGKKIGRAFFSTYKDGALSISFSKSPINTSVELKVFNKSALRTGTNSVSCGVESSLGCLKNSGPFN